MHINDEDDNNVQTLLDIMVALGMDQVVSFPTHCKYNILDLVFLETQSTELKVIDCHSGPFIIDHRLVNFQLRAVGTTYKTEKNCIQEIERY